MKFYVASKLANAENAHNLMSWLIEQGHTITFDWTTGGSLVVPADKLGPMEMARISNLEINGVSSADAVIAVVPMGFGAHVELGIAIALNKPVIMIGEDEETLRNGAPYDCVFYYAPNVYRTVVDRADFGSCPEFQRPYYALVDTYNSTQFKLTLKDDSTLCTLWKEALRKGYVIR